MPLHKTPLCSFKYVGQSISSSAIFKYNTVGKLSKSAEVKIYHGEDREIVKVDPKTLNGENSVVIIEHSKELYGETNIINVERLKTLYYYDRMMLSIESFKKLYNNIRTIDKDKPKMVHDQLIGIDKLNLKQIYTDTMEMIKDHTKDLCNFNIGIAKEDLKSMSLNHNIGIDLNIASAYENIDDYREILLAASVELYSDRLSLISKLNQISLSRNLDHEISNIVDEKALIVKSIDPFLNKSEQKILNVNRATKINIPTALEFTLIRNHELNKNDDYSLKCENILSMDHIEASKHLIKRAIFDLDKSNQISLLNISTINMSYDPSNQHYLNYGGMIDLKDTFIHKSKLLKLQNTNDMSKSDDLKCMNLSVFRKMNILNADKILKDVEIRYIFKSDIASFQHIRWEHINIEHSLMISRLLTTFTVSHNKDLDRIIHCDICKSNDAQLTYDHHTLIDIENNIELSHVRCNEISLSDQNKYIVNESEILIDYSKFRNVNAIHSNTNIFKSDDKELAPMRDIRSIMLNDTFALDCKVEHVINKESSLEIAASHYDEFLKVDTKFLSKFGKIIDKVAKNKFVYGSEIAIDKSESVMVNPYGPISMYKNTNRLIYKTYKIIGKIGNLNALKGHVKQIYTDNHNKGLNKLVIPTFNSCNDRWVTKNRLNIFTDKQKFVEETPWSIAIDEGYFLNKDRIDMFRQDQKPMYRERMPIIYEIPSHLLEVTNRWWVLGSHGPYDQKILPFDYGYSNQPLWINRRDRELGGHFMKLKNHPISYMPYLEDNKGKDLNYGTHEIEVSIEIMLDMANILTMIFKHSSSQFANCSGQEAIEFIMELFFDWLNLESTKDEMARKGSRSHYLRCYRWFRWEAEKVWFIANNDHIQDRMHGIKYAGMLVKNVLEYMKNHHFNIVPLWRNITFMDIERQFNRSATNGDLMKDLDKTKGKRHYFIETKNLGGNKI